MAQLASVAIAGRAGHVNRVARSEDIRCVVCGGPVGDAQYANAWEKQRKRYPCCGAACVARFDPMEHWVPARQPEVASDEDQARLLAVARRRLGEGDEPTIVVREMLVAGIPAAKLRGVLILVGGSAEREQDEHRWIQAVVFVISFRWLARRPTDRRDPKKIARANADVDAWERRWGQ